ncbi:MAG: hypothetical protein ABH834_06485 [Candidatus Altiarchaeota archaeon]
MEIYRKNIGEYASIMTTPLVFFIAVGIVQFVVRIIGYFLQNNLVRILGWVLLAFMEAVWVIMLVYISWVAVSRKRWSAINTLIAGIIFGFLAGFVAAVALSFGNVVAMIVAGTWTVFKVAAWSGVSVVFLPIIKGVLGGFVAGIIGLILEK